MPISIPSRWGFAAVGLTLALVGGWGVMSYVDQHKREVVVPGQLLEHLRDVHQGRAKLDAQLLSPDALRARQQAEIRSQLTLDMRSGGHPDPDGATALLLPQATGYLQADEGLARALSQRLQSLPDDWSTLQKQSDRWRIQAGEECLVLAYQPDAPSVLWQWVAIDGCSAESG